jgi:parallel beta-helix repeat protein
MSARSTLFSALLALGLAGLGDAATLTVTTNADSGAGSLRQAMLDSNASAGTLDTIAFAIPGGGVHTITPASALPTITDPVVIDGTTQPGFAGMPLVELDGSTAAGTGLMITAGSSTVRGLVINRWATGISISGAGQNLVAGNFIGTDASGVLPLGNDTYGVNIDGSSNNLVGGAAVGEGNLIAFNSVRGVRVSDAAGNTIRGNAIHSNSLGIDLDPNDGVTANDPGDGDDGANDLQNWPVISSVEVLSAPQGTGTRIQGVLHSAGSILYDLDFHENPACSRFPGGYLEGVTYIGSGQVTTDGSGTGVFDVTLAAVVADGARITATATDPAGNTSEFSQRIVFSCLPFAGPATGGTDVTLVGSDFAAGATVSIGGLPATNVQFVSFTRITATTPSLPAGSANDVVVTNTDGTSGTRTKGFIAEFLDVPQSHQFWGPVMALISFGITAGIGDGLYGVDQPTLRRQMAVFLLKAKYGLCYTPPPCTIQVFDDVPCSSGFAPWINQLVAEGVTGGCGDGTNYCPTDPVLRQQMAALLLRSFEGIGYAPPACTVATFGDVPCSNPFSAWIYELVARSITAGCGGGNYCPTDSANRGQMATFIVKTFF